MTRPAFIFRYPLAAILFFTAGCQVKQQQPVAESGRLPVVVDEAMQHRQWPVSVCGYPNGQTPGWPTGFVLTADRQRPLWQQLAADDSLFVINSVAMPVVFILTPPWKQVVYPGVVVNASHNVQPPLPAR